MTQSLEQLLQTQVARWSERVADWEAFAAAKVEGYCVSCPADVVHGFENVGLRARTS